MEVVIVIAGVISALAAVGAVWFAYQAVRETRALRREDRLARLAELIVDAGEGALELITATGRSQWTYPITTLRLKVALALADEELPASEKLADAAASMRLDGTGSADEARNLTMGALDELRGVLRESRTSA